MSYLQSTLDQFIELSGDRTGELGEGINTGLAWIDRYRLILLADNGESRRHNAGSWRRASRIIGLARHLRKPLLFWNLSFHRATDRMNDAGAEHALQVSEQSLIEFPAPIISVMEAAPFGAFSAVELAVPEATVFVDGAEALCEYLSISPRTIHAAGGDEIAAGISELLTHVASIPTETLVAERKARLASIALSCKTGDAS